MKYFSWKLASFFAFAHLMAVLMLGMLVYINTLGRGTSGFPVVRPSTVAHGAPGYETAFKILIQPLGSAFHEFDRNSIEWLFGLVVLNSLIWGLAVATLIGVFRRLRRPSTAPIKNDAPIIE